MKNVMKVLAVLLFIFTANVQAQSNCTKETEKKVEVMKEKLSLSDTQTKEVKALLTDKTANFSENIKAILTPEQFIKYQQMAKSCSIKEKKSCSTKGKKSCSTKEKKSCSKDAKKKSCCKKK